MQRYMALSVLAVILASGGTWADEGADALLLSVPFEKNNNVSAAFAAGENTPTNLGGTVRTVSMEPIELGWAMAFETGMKDQAVSFPAQSNFVAEAGTVTFWVKGRQWDIQGAVPDILFTADGSAGRLALVRDKPGLLAAVVERGAATARCEGALNVDVAQVRHVAMTYDAKSLRLYVDGREIAATEKPPLPAAFERIVIGQLGAGQAKPNKLIDNVKVYGRALTAGEIAQRFWVEGQFAPRREAAVLKTRRAITLDGKIGAEEWSDAAKLSALINCKGYCKGTRLLSDEQSMFYVTYDDTYLYVAMDSPIPADVRNDPHMTAGMGGLLKCSCTKHDVSVDSDDAMEINVVIPPVNGGLYRLVCNGLNTTYDYTTGGSSPESPVRGIDIKWDPKWEVANTVNIDTWQVEARIPLADFVKVNPPTTGTVWGLNVRRLWKKLRTEDSAWTDGYRYLDQRDLCIGAYAKGLPGLVRFAGEQGLSLRLEGAGLVNFGRLDLHGEVIARGAGGHTVTVHLASNSGEVTETLELKVPENGAAPFRIKRQFKDPTTTLLTLSVTDRASGERVALAEIPCALQQALKISSRFYPSFGAYKVEMDLTGLSEIPLGDLKGMILVQDRRTGQTVLKEFVRGFRAYRQNQELDIRSVPPGQYDVNVVIFNKDEVAHTQIIPFEKKPAPEWLGNQIGNSATPPYPFEPITVDKSDLNVWGRRYAFKSGLYPDQVMILGRKLLREPMAVVLKPAGADELRVQAASDGTDWLSATAVRVEGVRKGSAGSFKVMNSFWMEYDGFLWSRLVVQTTENTVLEGLRLEIPFTPEFSDVFNPYDYSLRETGKITEKGWSGAFRPIWVGNARGGLQWLAEHDGAWEVEDPQKEIRLRSGPEGATLVITFVDKPVRVDLPLEIEFGLVATPVKDSHAVDYRAPTIEWSYSWFSPNCEMAPGIDAWPKAGKTTWIKDLINAPSSYPSIPSRARKKYTGPYVCTGRVKANTDDFAQFGDEWYINTEDRFTGAKDANYVNGSSINVSQNSKSYQDYFVYKYWQLMQVSPFASLYYDVSREHAGDNQYAGLGYLRRDGTRVASSSILGNREIQRRLYTLVKERFPDAVIKNHNSGMVNMAYMAFCDHFVEGECTINMLTQDRKDYRGKIRPDTYRAEMMGHNFGFVTDFLYQFTRSGMWTREAMRKAGPDILDHIWGQTLLHDCCTWDAYAPFEFSLRWRRPLARHNWGMQYKFIPYWEQDIAKMPRDGLFASFYLEEPVSRAIMIVYNDTEWEGELSIPLDWKKLKLDSPAGVQVENAAHHFVETADKNEDARKNRYVFKANPKESARLVGGAVVFPMTAYNYRMIVLERVP